MSSKGRILMADDEPIFLSATADLLRREGYECVTVEDGIAAIDKVGEESFDLLITDLEMPGNADLQLVRQIAERSGGLPVIILTGYPSVRSAIACIELPVAAYLTKPVVFEDLLDKVKTSVGRFQAYQVMQRTEQRLKVWREEFQSLTVPASTGVGASPDVFLALTLRNVMGSLTDLEQLSKALNKQPVEGNPCQLMNCPRGAQLQAAIQETVRVLEETRTAFKSKTLGDLRHRLELLMEHV